MKITPPLHYLLAALTMIGLLAIGSAVFFAVVFFMVDHGTTVDLFYVGGAGLLVLILWGPTRYMARNPRESAGHILAGAKGMAIGTLIAVFIWMMLGGSCARPTP